MSFRTKAMAGVVAGSIAIGGGFYFGKRSLDTLAPTRPELQAVAHCAIRQSTVDFTVYHGHRTDEEHATMLAKGVSWVRRSKHQDGKAIDVMALDKNGKGTWAAAPYYEIAKAFYYCGDKLGTPITWGGEWRVKDLVHFEEK